MIRTTLFILALSAFGFAQAIVRSQPVIDVHIHAEPISEFGSGMLSNCAGTEQMEFPAFDPGHPLTIDKMFVCKHPIRASKTDDELRAETLSELKKNNVRRAIAFGPLDQISAWERSSHGVLIPGVSFARLDRSPDDFERLYKEGQLRIFAELGFQYRGMSPSDERLEPYFALAEKLDIPVGIHMGEGPPGGLHIIGPSTYRVALGDPLLLEPLLIRHPKLRVYVMHYGSPMVDNMIAIMFSHPEVYVDISCNDWPMPRKQFYDHLRRLVEAGYGKRIMFGSDQMGWPGSIKIAIDSVKNAPFLTRAQKRDILYNNAAAFLRLTPAQIAEDKR